MTDSGAAAPAPTAPVTAARPTVPVTRLGGAADEAKQRGVRRMKAVALSFLLGATAVFVTVRAWGAHGGPSWLGYVAAAAEAGMVGGLADWFAVTALFRHPLGIPIPHTAIIPEKKDALGESLAEFVGTNFLSEDVVRSRLQRAGVARRLGEWLADPAHAARVTSELATLLRGALTVLRDDEVQAMLQQTVLQRVRQQALGPPAGRLLHGVVAGGGHRQLVDLIADRSYDWILENRDKVIRLVTDQAPTWSPRFIDQRVAERVYREALDFAWNVDQDKHHPLRRAIDAFLLEFADDLQRDPAMIAQAERVKHQVLEQPAVGDLFGSAWRETRGMVLEAAEDPDSPLRRRLTEQLTAFGVRLAEDAELQAKVDGWLQAGISYVVVNYRSDLTALVTDTVESWDAAETARKIELQVGRDLQFIRINGTVVGALAGLVIYTLAQLLG